VEEMATTKAMLEEAHSGERRKRGTHQAVGRKDYQADQKTREAASKVL